MSEPGVTLSFREVTSCDGLETHLERSVRDNRGAPRPTPRPRPELLRPARQAGRAPRHGARPQLFALHHPPQPGDGDLAGDPPAHLPADRRRFGLAVGAGLPAGGRPDGPARGLREQGGDLAGRGPAVRRVRRRGDFGSGAAPRRRGAGERRGGAERAVRGVGSGAAAPGVHGGAVRRPRPAGAAPCGERGPAGRAAGDAAALGVRAPDHAGVRCAAVPVGRAGRRLQPVRARLRAAGRDRGQPVGGRAHGHARRTAHVRGVRERGAARGAMESRARVR